MYLLDCKMQSTRLVLIAAAILFVIGTAPTINGHAILPSELIGLAECYKHYDYYRPLPQMDAEQAYKPGDGQFTHFFDPFLQIQSEIDECLQQKALKEVEKLKEHIFKESGISKWLENESAKLKKKHGEIGTKKIPGFDGVKAVMMLNDWRRTLMAFGLVSKNFAQVFASALIGHILDDDHHKHPAAAGRHIIKGEIEKQTRQNLDYMKKRLDAEWESNHQKLKWSGYMRHYTDNLREHTDNADDKDFYFTKYNDLMEKLKSQLAQVHIDWEKHDHGHPIEFVLPKVKRIISVVRHSERYDGTLPRDQKNKNKAQGYIELDGKRYGLDDSPLSENGKEIANKLGPTYKGIPISHVYSSGYVRTLDTCDRLLGEPSHHHQKIRIEYGFLEGMTAKQWTDVSKLTHQTSHEIKKGERIKLKNDVDCEYVSQVDKEEIKQEVDGYEGMPTPVFEQLKTCDDSLYPLVAKALAGITTANKQNNDASGRHIIENISAHYPWLAPGEENAEHIVVVTHASVITAMQQLFDGKYTPVPPASITKFVELEETQPVNHGKQLDEHNKEHHGKQYKADADGLQSRFRMIFGAVTTHLGQIDDPGFYQ